MPTPHLPEAPGFKCANCGAQTPCPQSDVELERRRWTLGATRLVHGGATEQRDILIHGTVIGFANYDIAERAWEAHEEPDEAGQYEASEPAFAAAASCKEAVDGLVHQLIPPRSWPSATHSNT